MNIEAKKDKLFGKMLYLHKKFRHLDIFEREQDDKFVEDSSQLTKVGNEIFHNFGLEKTDIKLFADICSAPGMYSKIVLDKFKTTIGIGVSLPVEEGGVPYELKDSRYKIFYKNILDKNYKLELNQDKNLKLDLGMASCVSYQHDVKNSFLFNVELIIKSLMLLLPNLKTGGNLIINMTMKNIELAFNMVHMLSELFNSFKLWKSPNVWATKNTFYFFGYGFKQNYNPDVFTDLIERIKFDNDPINRQFLGTNEDYEQIYNKMRHIYLVKIRAWEDLIRKSKEKEI